MPLFSVVVPTFNAGAKLQRTLDSFRAQNADDLETWVQDGASSDGTRELLASRGDIGWSSEPDNGVFDAMNRGIARTSGQWLAFFGAGDLLRAGALDALRALALEHKNELALLYGDAWLCEEGFRYGGPFSRLKLRSWTPSHQAIFVNRRVFEKWGGFEEHYPIAADYAFNLRCWGDPKIEKIYVPCTLCDYEGRGLSKTVRDVAFERDKMRLIRQRLGFDAFLLRRLELMMPRSVKAWRVRLLQKRARQNAR